VTAWASRSRGDEGSGASRRWQRLPLDRSRVRSVGGGSGSEPRLLSPWPPPPLIVTVRRGPPAKHGLGVPDQDARSGPTPGRWAKYGGDQTNKNYSTKLTKTNPLFLYQTIEGIEARKIYSSRSPFSKKNLKHSKSLLSLSKKTETSSDFSQSHFSIPSSPT
jgi:hypothetical protein